MVRVDMKKIQEIADVIKNAPDGKPLNFFSFTGATKQDPVSAKMYPPLDHPRTIDFFFLACMHQYGFWIGNDKGYEQPLYACFRDVKKPVKGSDALWRSMRRALDRDPELFAPERLAEISYHDFLGFFSDDNGVMPYPDLEHRFMMTRKYGAEASPDIPQKIVSRANDATAPLDAFIGFTCQLPGYDGDLLFKKNRLLAMALENRPEGFLKVPDDWARGPIVEYHLMRLALRLGGISCNKGEARILEGKLWVGERFEQSVRNATEDFWDEVTRASGKTYAQVDNIAWMARKYCPETETPDCGKCVFTTACDKRTELFQPVIRTDNY